MPRPRKDKPALRCGDCGLFAWASSEDGYCNGHKHHLSRRRLWQRGCSEGYAIHTPKGSGKDGN